MSPGALTPAKSPTQSVARNSIQTFQSALGDVAPVATSSSSFDIDFPSVVLFDGGQGAKILADVSLSFVPTLQFVCQIDGFSLKQMRFATSGTLTADLSFTAGISFEGSKTFLLGTPIALGTITITAGFVPVTLTPKIAAAIGIEGKITAGLKESATMAATLTAGLSYAANTWSPIADLQTAFTFQPVQPSAEADAKLFLAPQLKVTIEGIVGPYLTVKPSVELKLSTSSPQYQLFAGITADVGVKLEVLDVVIADYERPAVLSYTKLLTQGDFNNYKYTLKSVGTLPGGTGAGVHAINGLGQLVGGATSPDRSTQSYMQAALSKTLVSHLVETSRSLRI